MQISSAAGQATTLAKINNKANTLGRDSVRLLDAENAAQIEQEQSSNQKAQSSIVIDEQAIALFEENRASQLVQGIQSQTYQNSFSSASQDQPTAKNETAVASYQTVGNLAQRESVQKLFGVDLFA